jgi:hypothetical protein
MRSLKLTLASLLALAAAALVALQLWHMAQGHPGISVLGAAGGVGLLALMSFLLFYSALVGDWELPPSRRDAPRSWMDGLRRPIDPESRFGRRLSGARSLEGRLPGDVGVIFHTYWGVLAFIVQTEWTFALPADEAQAILREMHRSNLAWSNLAFGALVIPILSLIEYWQQLRSIRKQEGA